MEAKVNSLRNIPIKAEVSSNENDVIRKYQTCSNLAASSYGQDHDFKNESQQNFLWQSDLQDSHNHEKVMNSYENYLSPDEGGLTPIIFEKQSRGFEGSTVSKFKEDEKLASYNRKSFNIEKRTHISGSWDLPPKSSNAESSRKNEHVPDDKKLTEYLKSSDSKNLIKGYESENMYKRSSKTKSEANLSGLVDSKFIEQWESDNQHKKNHYHSAKKVKSKEKDIFLKDEINILDDEIGDIQQILKKEFGLDP